MKTINRIILISGIFIVIAAALFVGAFFAAQDQLTVKLIGEENITLELGEVYTEKGCESYFGDAKVNNITIQGGVDTSVPGVYKITYIASFLTQEKKAIRTVRVKDSIKPVISAPETLEIPVGADIKSIPFEYGATDNYDGDIKNRITVEYSENKIVLKVNDSSGNLSICEIPVVRIPDTVPPVISLSGNKNVFLVLGDEYKEAGYTASDNIDGDITRKVVVSGEEDFLEAGNYTVSYTVADSSENTVTATRNVYVYNPDATSVTPDENSKVIYLTFDDGPCIYTPQILDLLERYKVKATFFVTNQKPDWQSYIGTAFNNGHAIGAHTYSHNYSIYTSSETYFNDLNAINDIIKEQTGQHTNLLRFPGGSSNTISRKYNKGIMSTLVNEVTEQGYVYFDWNIVSGDADSTSQKNNPDYIYNNVVLNLKTGANIVLMHDINPANLTALPRIIEYGITNGYMFLPLNPSSPTAHHPVLN